MAEGEAQKYPVRLYDANGYYTGEVDHDVDMSAATTRGGVMRYSGKNYVWDQRSSQWREASEVYEVKGKMTAAEPANPEAAAEDKSAKK